MEIHQHHASRVTIRKDEVRENLNCTDHDLLTVTVYHGKGEPVVLTLYGEPNGIEVDVGLNLGRFDQPEGGE